MKSAHQKKSQLAAATRSTNAIASDAIEQIPEARTTPAQCLADGAAGGASVVNTYTRSSSIDSMELLVQLQRDAQAIHAGDFRQIEAMLMNQAVALQSMFTDFALLASRQTSAAATQCYAQLALRAQGGCRATLQTLAEVKNPRQVAFVRQTNVAQTQQVNNGTSMRSGARSPGSAQNELLVEEQHGSQTMDFSAEAATGRIDSGVGPLEPVNRPSKRRWKA